MRRLGRHIVDRVFEEGLSEAEMPVSGKVWANLASEMEKERLRRQVVAYKWLAAASVTLLIGFGTWMLILQSSLTTSFQAAQAKLITRQVQLPSFAMSECRGNAFALTPSIHGTSPWGKTNASDAFAGAMNGHLRVQVDELHPRMASGTLQREMVSEALLRARSGTERIRKSIPTRLPSLLSGLTSDNAEQPWMKSTPKIVTPVPVEPRFTLGKEKEREYTFWTDSEDEPKQRKAKRWELAAGFAPDMTLASTTPLDQGARSSQLLADDPTQANTNVLSPVMAYAASMRTTMKLNDRWALRGGLSCLYRRSSATATAAAKNGETLKSNLDLYTMELPLSVKYNVIHDKNFEYFVASGVSGFFFLHYDNTLQASDGTIAARRSSDLTQVLKPSQASLLFSTGLNYRLFDRLSLQLEPGIRYGLLTNEYAFSQSRPLSMSLLSGLNYHF